MNPIGKIVLLLCSLTLLGGCVVGQKYNMRDTSADFTVSGSKLLGVAAQDKRAYVLSGDKSPDYIGTLRGGFGNPWDVATESGKPLAEDITQVLSASLAKKGFRTTPVIVLPNDPMEKVMEKLLTTQGETLILVTLNQWKADTYVTCSVNYDISVKIFDRVGQLIAASNVKGDDNLGGSMDTASYTKEVVPKAFKKKIEELFNNPAVITALQK